MCARSKFVLVSSVLLIAMLQGCMTTKAIKTEETHAKVQEGNWRVTLSTGDTLTECKLLDANDSLFVFHHSDTTMSVPVDSVVSLFRHKEGHFWTGAGYGALGGFFVGVVIGAAVYEKPQPKPDPNRWINIGPIGPDFGAAGSAVAGGVIGGFAGVFIGGAIGASTGGDELYELSKRPQVARIMILRKAVSEDR